MVAMQISLDKIAKHALAAREKAHAEMAAGQKKGHWIWWAFPTLKQRGGDEFSAMQRGADLKDVDAAIAYAKHPTLRASLLKTLSVANKAFDAASAKGQAPWRVLDKGFGRASDGVWIHGPVDSFKAFCCCTLFAAVAHRIGDAELRSASMRVLTHFTGDVAYTAGKKGSSGFVEAAKQTKVLLKGHDEVTLAIIGSDWREVSGGTTADASVAGTLLVQGSNRRGNGFEAKLQSSCDRVSQSSEPSASSLPLPPPSQPTPIRDLTDLPPELWESVLRHVTTLRERSACTRLCKALAPGARSKVDASLRLLKEELITTLRPAMSVQAPTVDKSESAWPRTFAVDPLQRCALPDSRPTDIRVALVTVAPHSWLDAGRAILSAALGFGRRGHPRLWASDGRSVDFAFDEHKLKYAGAAREHRLKYGGLAGDGLAGDGASHGDGATLRGDEFIGRRYYKCGASTRVLHAGATLRVQLSLATRTALGDAAWEGMVLRPPAGGYWTCEDVVHAQRRVVQPTFEEHRGRIEAAARASGAWDEESPPADRVEVVLSVQSFGLEEVVLAAEALAYNEGYDNEVNAMP